MFTGIIEEFGEVVAIRKEATNIHFSVRAKLTPELKIDQSVAHDGVCLTVVAIDGDVYVVTAIQETLVRSKLSTWKLGTKVNLERCMQMNGRLDGHLVQGHVDTIGKCVKIENQQGSWKYTFTYETNQVTVEKGSITVNGVSLTVVDSFPNGFSVCLIPYTVEHTNFGELEEGGLVNLEFDIIGKYVAKLISHSHSS